MYNPRTHVPFDVNIVSDVVDHYYFYDKYDGLKIAYVVWESTLLPQGFFERLAYFDEIWCPSHWQKDCMVKQGIPENKIKVVPAGVEADVFYPEDVSFDKYYNDGKFKFLLFGRWDYRKATQEIIETFLRTFNKNEPVELIASVDNILPKDEFKSTEERLKHFKLDDKRIKIVHYASRRDYINFVKKGHVFLSCARSEGWNLPLIEAMAAGTPSIYSNCSAQLEFAAGKGHPVNVVGETPAKFYIGNYYEPDFNHLSEVMRDVYENYAACKEKAVKESKEIRENFCWKRVGEIGAAALQAFYDSKKINAAKTKLKILYVTPHLSTGGMPQYLLKKIESLKDECEVYCVEYNQIATWYVIQRNKIVEMLGDHFFSLQDKPREQLLDVINKIQPDVVHVEEFPETFMRADIAKALYSKDRKYLIFESYHGLSFEAKNKSFFPDKFIFVSEYQADLYRGLGIHTEILEYPIEINEPNKDACRQELGFDPNYKHVLNVGLFNPWKNQGELVDYAKKMLDVNVKFHFVGNQAPNFEEYWGPIMKTLPDNCVIWKERGDVEKFYQAADLMVFTSKMETSPIVIREAIAWKLPCLIRNLPAYKNLYNKYPDIKYLVVDGVDDNVELIKKELHLL
jgi:glycosyltransferase involved in cell wall biosynthesis